MNRETKRLMERQGQVDAEGNPTRAPRPAPAARVPQERTSAPQYVREVRGELKKVGWPTRDEVKNYSAVVLATLVIMSALVFIYDFVFAKGLLFLIDR